MIRPARHERGFTLLEVIIAFAIAAIALAALSQAFSTGLRQVDRMDANTAAMMLAQQKLAELDTLPSLTAATQSGQTPTGDMWEIAITPRSAETAEVLLYDVGVTAVVDGAVVELRTTRLRSAP